MLKIKTLRITDNNYVVNVIFVIVSDCLLIMQSTTKIANLVKKYPIYFTSMTVILHYVSQLHLCV